MGRKKVSEDNDYLYYLILAIESVDNNYKIEDKLGPFYYPKALSMYTGGLGTTKRLIIF